MKRFAVFGYGYNPNIPVCYAFALKIEEAWEQAKELVGGRVFISDVVEEQPA